MPRFSLGYLGSGMVYCERESWCDDAVVGFVDIAAAKGAACAAVQLSSGYTKGEDGKRYAFNWNRNRSNAPLSEGNGWRYDGGVREPLIVRWPGVVKPGGRCETHVTSPDFFPTCLEAANAAPVPEQHVDGVSILPMLRGGAIGRDAIFWHYPHYSNQGDTPACAIRAGDWELIEHFKDRRLELFNLREYIGETSDLAAQMPERVQELHARLVAWRESIEAKIPEPNPDCKDMLAGRRPCPDGNGAFIGIVPGSDAHG